GLSGGPFGMGGCGMPDLPGGVNCNGDCDTNTRWYSYLSETEVVFVEVTTSPNRGLSFLPISRPDVSWTFVICSPTLARVLLVRTGSWISSLAARWASSR